MQCPPSLYLLLSHSNEKVSPKKLLSSRVVGCWVKPLQCRLLQLRVWFQLLLFRSESLLTQLGSNRSSLRDLSSLHSHGRPSSRLLTSASPRLSFQTNKYLKRLHYYDYWYLTERCFSQMPVSAGTGSGRSQKAETPSRFPVGWWGPSSLGPHCCLSECPRARSWNQEQHQALNQALCHRHPSCQAGRPLPCVLQQGLFIPAPGRGFSLLVGCCANSLSSPFPSCLNLVETYFRQLGGESEGWRGLFPGPRPEPGHCG